MKVRLGFVTNSSSSSFIISKKYIDSDQIAAIWNHIDLSKKMGKEIDFLDFPWDIEENDEFITGYVYMDNFDMYNFLEDIDVDLDVVEWHEIPINLDSYTGETYKKTKKKTWRDLLNED